MYKIPVKSLCKKTKPPVKAAGRNNMELCDLDVKILKLLSKQKSPVNLAFITKKCGECESSLNKLFRQNFIDSSWIDSLEQVGFPSFEDVTITKEGREYLDNLKLDSRNKTRQINKEKICEIVTGIFIAVAAGIILMFLAFQP